MSQTQLFKELFSIRDWLRYAVSQFESSDIFFGHGTSNAYDEAVWLIFGFLHLPHDTIENFLDAHITSKEKKDLQFLIEKRNPLTMPPNFDLLPPDSINQNNQKDEKDNLKDIFNKNLGKEKKDTEINKGSESGSLEKSILEKIK